jgi:hypothetical protein
MNNFGDGIRKRRARELGWAIEPDIKWMTQEQMNKLAADNPLQMLEIGKRRHRVISAAGIVSRIEP